jgi:hypothetical protein
MSTKDSPLVQPDSEESKGKNDCFSGLVYEINAPKILLESLSARSTMLVFAITYIAFIIGFGLDIDSAYTGFTSSNVVIPGVSSNPHSWKGTVTSLTNIISLSVSVQQTNFSSIIKNEISESKITSLYDAHVWACYKAEGCQDNFGTSVRSFIDRDAWSRVLSVTSEEISFSWESLKEDSIKKELIPNTFQNQESIPARGKVRSYYVEINYIENPSSLFTSYNYSLSENEVPPVEYTVSILNRPISTRASGACSVVLLFVACATLVSFIYIMIREKKKWLTGIKMFVKL